MTDASFMRRCFDLALLGGQKASPNPMVGAVLVYKNRIIGEGFHRAYGEAHAEVNAIRSVKEADAGLIRKASLYVSLEPCCFYGKTPPCTNLIIEKQIPRVVISCLDDSPQVAGKGVAQLREAGAEVVTGVLESEGRRLSRPRSVYVTHNRPYIILKYAQSRDGKFCPADRRQFWITNAYTKRLVHKWRSETDAILVGTRTAEIDDPRLTNRLYFGPSPLRIVIDRQGRLSPNLKLFNGDSPTLVVTHREAPEYRDKVDLLQIQPTENLLEALLAELHRRRLGVLLVEGGLQLLEYFLHEGCWDEARVLVGEKFLPGGRPAPDLGLVTDYSWKLAGDDVLIYRRPLASTPLSPD